MSVSKNHENKRQTNTFNMKKTVLFAAALFTVAAATAQTGEITSAKGENWLSQDGDWGLTFDAQPLLNYAGNLFNGNTGNGGVAVNNLFSSTGLNGFALPNSGTGVVIGGKKMIDANTAYRGKLRIGFGSTKFTDLVAAIPQPSGATQTATVEDVTKNGYMAINLGAGMEKRVGSTRVVGIYGAELNIGFGSSKTTNEYGNALSNDNQVQSRPTETKNGGVFGLGVNAFAGIEWFCAPKISLSGEYTWGIAMQSQGIGETTSEGWDPTANNNSGAVTTVTVEGDGGLAGTDKTNRFSIDTGISGASVGLNFYFQ